MKPLTHTLLLRLLLLASLGLHGPAARACELSSGPTMPVVVELYTSEGCSSCPPADRWLSSLAPRSDVLALAFHVDYWNRLGWTDRFATPQATARQYELARLSGSSGVYTPQVRVDGQDWTGWPRLPQTALPSPVRLTLARSGQNVTALITAMPGAPQRLAGYWAVVENGYESHVRAGENAGATLHHDHVVRLYQPVDAWDAAQAQRVQLEVSAGVTEHPRQVVFVVVDPASGRPLQALALSC
jgi:hypothetical protein